MLFRLTRQPGLRQVELADMLDVEPITLCRIVDRLEEAGLVERSRDPDGPPRLAAACHRKAQPLIEKLQAVGDELIDDAFAGIDPKDIEMTRQVLARVRENAGRCRADEQGIEPMNKMATEPMTGAEAARGADGQAQARKIAAQGRLAHDPDADRAGAAAARRRLLLADQRRQRVDRRRRR